jgi:hypothetical protein
LSEPVDYENGPFLLNSEGPITIEDLQRANRIYLKDRQVPYAMSTSGNPDDAKSAFFKVDASRGGLLENLAKSEDGVTRYFTEAPQKILVFIEGDSRLSFLRTEADVDLSSMILQPDAAPKGTYLYRTESYLVEYGGGTGFEVHSSGPVNGELVAVLYTLQNKVGRIPQPVEAKRKASLPATPLADPNPKEDKSHKTPSKTGEMSPPAQPPSPPTPASLPNPKTDTEDNSTTSQQSKTKPSQSKGTSDGFFKDWTYRQMMLYIYMPVALFIAIIIGVVIAVLRTKGGHLLTFAPPLSPSRS